jgi:hypothetical protein
MKAGEERTAPDSTQPSDHQRRWLKAGAALLLLGCAGSVTVCLCAAAWSQRPLEANLIEAVKRGDVVDAKRLLDQGANPNTREVVLTKPSLAERTEGGKPTLADTALMIAIQMRNTQLVKVLLHKGADVNGTGVAGFIPLMEAIRRRYTDLAKLLLENRAKPNQRNDYGDTA